VEPNEEIKVEVLPGTVIASMVDSGVLAEVNRVRAVAVPVNIPGEESPESEAAKAASLPFMCPWCGKVTQNASLMRKHILIHISDAAEAAASVELRV
jgi:hypothetical protein